VEDYTQIDATRERIDTQHRMLKTVGGRWRQRKHGCHDTVHRGSAHLVRGELDSLVQIDARVKRRLRVCMCVEWRKSVTVSCSARQTTATSKARRSHGRDTCWARSDCHGDGCSRHTARPQHRRTLFIVHHMRQA
jgi:hypothetical protein